MTSINLKYQEQSELYCICKYRFQMLIDTSFSINTFQNVSLIHSRIPSLGVDVHDHVMMMTETIL